jgi:hypothetical protein
MWLQNHNNFIFPKLVPTSLVQIHGYFGDLQAMSWTT